jgi:Tol biopolymer transport system component
LLTDAVAGQYANGYLLFNRADGVSAQRFDVDRLTLEGKPSFVVGPVAEWYTYGSFSVSQTGVLAYKPRQPVVLVESRLTWYDRAGRSLGPVGETGIYRGFALSPDERSVAVHVHEATGGGIWIRNLETGNFARLTFGSHDDIRPLWSPDGRLILYASNEQAFYKKRSNGSGDAEVVFESSFLKFPESWSRDGKVVLFTQWAGADAPGSNVWELPVDGGEPKPVLKSEFSQALSQFSPDGRWVAYTSSESGREEVYVRSYPDLGGKRSISTGGGSFPRWARNGRELFYLAGAGTLMAVPIDVEADALLPGMPHALFTANFVLGDHVGESDVPYDVSSDGQRFLVNERVAPETDLASPQNSSFTVIVNWNTAPRL